MHTTSEPIVIGVIGCGSISDIYLLSASRSRLVQVKACADLRAEVAQAKAAEYNIEAMSVERLLADPDIEIVMNLTVPLAHAEVSQQIIDAGKHVYSEKPLAAKLSDAQTLLSNADAKGLRVGCAPDTFLGASHQACRYAIDHGRIGQPVSGIASVLSHGMEHWHPNPEFFYKTGAGPVLDLGPYYLTQLVNLLGPVTQVAAQLSIPNPTRTVSSEPLAGQIIDVEVPTTASGLLTFASGAHIMLSASWDVWKHKRLPFEIYGKEGSLLVPDPNFFGGEVWFSEQDGDWQALDISVHPFGVPNYTTRSGAEVANYRIIGLLDMAAAIQQNRPHRASGELALHVLEVMEAFDISAQQQRYVAISSSCERPEVVPLGSGEEVFLL